MVCGPEGVETLGKIAMRGLPCGRMARDLFHRHCGREAIFLRRYFAEPEELAGFRVSPLPQMKTPRGAEDK